MNTDPTDEPVDPELFEGRSDATTDGAPAWSDALADYERLIVVGHGGTATVYSASRVADGEPVAIKVFDASETSPFERQLRAGERLGDQPGVLTVSAHGSLPDGRRYIVSPFAHGGSLAEQIQRFGPMAAARVASLGSDLAHSLGTAHASGVLHRDIKPSNVLLDRSGLPLLADFGAATVAGPITASDTLAVTVMYAAPEVLEGAPATEESDVYSLGLTLLALAAGAQPFGDVTDSGLAPLVNEICGVGAPDPSRFGIPAGLGAVLRQATSVDPAERYRSGEAFAAALDEARADLETPPQDSTRTPRTAAVTGAATDASTRHRALLGAAAVALVALVVGGVLWLRSSDGADGGAGTETAGETTAEATAELLGDPITEENGIMGPLYQQDDITYVGMLAEPCNDDDTLVELSIHAGPADTAAGVDTPWAAVSGQDAGTFMAWMPCDTGIHEARFKLGAPGRWFVFTAEFPQDQYDHMVEVMRGNETSVSPDYTVDEDVLATLADPDVYKGWAIIDRPA